MLWLVTGCSSGIGLSLAHAILEAGQQCIATSRNPSQTPEAVASIEKLGGTWLTLDVTSPDLEDKLAKIIAQHGPIDVLVNNAGYAAGGVFESYPVSQDRAQFETNFFSPLRLMKAIIPTMRERKTGVIVNISSSQFFNPTPVTAIYTASKFALEGLAECIAGEIAAFGMRMLLVEPGATRSAFVAKSRKVNTEMDVPEAYKGTVADYVMQFLLNMEGKQEGDPDKTAQAILEEVLKPSADPPLLRLPLGKQCVQQFKAKAEQFRLTAEAREEVAVSTDFPEGT